MKAVEIKRGDTLLLECAAQTAGVPIDLSGWNIACQTNGPGGFAHAFAPAIVDATAGRFDLVATPAETAAWPLGTFAADIQYTDTSGRVISTETWSLLVLADETP